MKANYNWIRIQWGTCKLDGWDWRYSHCMAELWQNYGGQPLANILPHIFFSATFSGNIAISITLFLSLFHHLHWNCIIFRFVCTNTLTYVEWRVVDHCQKPRVNESEIPILPYCHERYYTVCGESWLPT